MAFIFQFLIATILVLTYSNLQSAYYVQPTKNLGLRIARPTLIECNPSAITLPGNYKYISTGVSRKQDYESNIGTLSRSALGGYATEGNEVIVDGYEVSGRLKIESTLAEGPELSTDEKMVKDTPECAFTIIALPNQRVNINIHASVAGYYDTDDLKIFIMDGMVYSQSDGSVEQFPNKDPNVVQMNITSTSISQPSQISQISRNRIDRRWRRGKRNFPRQPAKRFLSTTNVIQIFHNLNHTEGGIIEFSVSFIENPRPCNVLSIKKSGRIALIKGMNSNTSCEFVADTPLALSFDFFKDRLEIVPCLPGMRAFMEISSGGSIQPMSNDRVICAEPRDLSSSIDIESSNFHTATFGQFSIIRLNQPGRLDFSYKPKHPKNPIPYFDV